MLSFIGRSMVQKIITLFFVSIVSFLIIHLAPGEPSQVDPTNPKFTPEMVEKFREAFHLDEPLYPFPGRIVSRCLKRSGSGF
jgi:peptide/nickel transport system permease protein